jgi:hypothetical protein
MTDGIEYLSKFVENISHKVSNFVAGYAPVGIIKSG